MEMTVPLGHTLLFLAATLAGLESDSKWACRVFLIGMYVLFALICLSWQAEVGYSQWLNPAFANLIGELALAGVLGIFLGKGYLEILKLIKPKPNKKLQ